MTASEIIALVTSIAALGSATAAFLAVKLSTKHHEASYSPAFAIARTFLSAKSDSGKMGLPVNWAAMPKSGEINTNYLFFYIPLINIGLGAAKEINITWSFQIEMLVGDINKHASNLNLPIQFDYKHGTLSLRNNEKIISESIWEAQKNNSVDYILPVSSNPNGFNLNLPLAYIDIASTFVLLSYLDKNSDRYTPNINIRLKYLDVGGKKHTITYELTLEIVSISSNGTNVTEFDAEIVCVT